VTVQDYRRGMLKTRVEGLPAVDDQLLADYDAKKAAEKAEAETYRKAWEAEEGMHDFHEAPTREMPANYQETFLTEWNEAPTLKLQRPEGL
jgi:stress response protein YsnF